jgi:hypothetical protein
MRTVVVFAERFDEDSGGTIALHRLVDLLNRGGHRALLWPWNRPLADPSDWLRTLARRWRWHRIARRHPYRTGPGFIAPVATSQDLDGAIVVYPEVISGNPLRAQHVVRWLLHRPGFHTGTFEYGGDDRFFFYQRAFDDPTLNPDRDNQLRTIWVRDDVYRHLDTGPRVGNCYMLRKGVGRPLVHDLTDSVLVDGLSHVELAKVFNRVQTCISYDTYTMYSRFAALCGCDSVVVPEEGVSKEQWQPDPRDRYGLAYGFDDLDEARRTRPLLLPYLKERESAANQSVRSFVEKCEAYFP